MPKPRPHLKLKAEMILRGLDLTTLVKGTKIPYTTASEILGGVRNDPVRLAKLTAKIMAKPRLEEAHV